MPPLGRMKQESLATRPARPSAVVSSSVNSMHDMHVPEARPMYGALVLRISRTSERADATEPKKKTTEQRHLSDAEEFADRLDLRTAQGLVKLARSAKPE